MPDDARLLPLPSGSDGQTPVAQVFLDLGVATVGLAARFANRLPLTTTLQRRYFETAMLEVMSKSGARDPEYVLAAEWQLSTGLGVDAGAEPALPDAAAWAVKSWRDWAKNTALEPLAI